jgi:flagella basal body P-ring formation protein FlgA
MTKILVVVLAIVGLCVPGVAASDELMRTLQQLAANHLGCDTAQVRVILADRPQLAGPLSDFTLRFASEPRGRTVVRAVSPEHRDLSFSVDIELWSEVAVARSRIARGTPLDTSLFEFATREISHLTPVLPSQIPHLRARRAMAPGAILSTASTERIPLIRRGSRVTLQANRGGVRISRLGTALADADLGETVRIRIDRRTIIPATVADTNLCSVSL